MNTQFAIQGDDIYVIEVNPRAARTVPFVSKATGVSLAKVAARCMAGKSLEQQGCTQCRHRLFQRERIGVPVWKVPGRGSIVGP